MTLFKQYLKTFSLAYLFFAFTLWFGCILFGHMDNELGSYLFWFTIIFGLAVITIQSLIFSIIPFKVTRIKSWFFIIALISELVLLNLLAAFAGTQNFTVDTIIDIFHNAGDLVFPVTMHIAIIVSLITITWTKLNRQATSQ